MEGPASAYLFVKYLHVACVVASLAGFAVRGALMLAASPLLGTRFVRVAPHVVDTLLLASAAWLAWFLGQYPFVHAWLTAKVLGLVAYIVLGTIALKRGRTRIIRIVAFAAALAAAGYVVSVALTRDPAGFLAPYLSVSGQATQVWRDGSAAMSRKAMTPPQPRQVPYCTWRSRAMLSSHLRTSSARPALRETSSRIRSVRSSES